MCCFEVGKAMRIKLDVERAPWAQFRSPAGGNIIRCVPVDPRGRGELRIIILCHVIGSSLFEVETEPGTSSQAFLSPAVDATTEGVIVLVLLLV